MSISLDAGVNALIGQAMTMQQISTLQTAQVKLAKNVHASQENAVMTLISSAGLTTYDASGALQSVAVSGQHVNTTA